MRFMPATRALHARLSAASCKFLDFVERSPACLDRREFAALAPADDLYGHVLQPWPTFVNARRVAEMAAASVGICSLIKDLGERLFQRDPARLASFYGLGMEQAVPIAAALGDPDLLDGVIARGDFLDSPEGLKCTEFNMGGNLGGWQSKLWTPRFLRVPVVARFCAEHGIHCRARDTLRLFLLHVVDSLRGAVAGGTLNLALVVAPEFQISRTMEAFLEAELRQVLSEASPGVRGRVLLCREAELAERAGRLWLGDERIDAVSEQHPMAFGGSLLGCFAQGGTRYFNGPLRLVLDDKRNLALLSEQLESSLFDAEQRRLIAAHVPWTRRVHGGRERFAGEVVALPEMLAAQRGRLVLKRAVSYAGTDVHLGAATPAATWDGLVRRAVEEGGWVVQERVEMVPYVYQAGIHGCAPHDVVWGLFVFGRSYGGAFLRLLPQHRGAVINTANGATEGVVFEIDE